ncbi:MAG: Abi family protein [Tannerellaceae bacterium]|nr:Abi family protein [Tannerellaceae bacterium]
MEKLLYSKPYLPYFLQIELLKSRGMFFADEAKAAHLLKHISYYRFSGYWYPLLANKQEPVFKPNATFEAAFNLYKFDRELRKLIIAGLEKIEVSVRLQMAYALSTTYDAFWMEDSSLFSDVVKHKSTLAKIKDEVSRSDEEFIVSFKSKYSNPLPPSFITLEVVSFGGLSRLYENLQAGLAKRQISQVYGLADKVFSSWLHSFVYIRNVCAHHARFWNRWLQIQPLFPRHTDYVWLTDREIKNNRTYYALSMILYFLNIVNPNHSFKKRLEELFAKYPNVDRTAMGFPADWHIEPLWK